jgi:hypothetical protein
VSGWCKRNVKGWCKKKCERLLSDALGTFGGSEGCSGAGKLGADGVRDTGIGGAKKNDTQEQSSLIWTRCKAPAKRVRLAF